MEPIRLNKVARLIQKEVAAIFQQEANGMFQGKMITVTTARVSPDLSVAKIYISIFPYKENEKYLTYINYQTKLIRNQLGKKIRHQLRIIPELIFYRDDSIDYADRIDKLLKK